MLPRIFDKPVFVLVGLGIPRRIETVFDAYRFLLDWPGNSPQQRAALRACKAAFAGEIDAETARGVFVAFAQRKDILVEEERSLPWLVANDRGRSPTTPG